MTSSACPCWNITDGAQAVAIWTMVFSLIQVGILGWQTAVVIGCRDNMEYVAMRDRHTSCYSLPEQCPCFRDQSTRTYQAFLHTAYILQLMNLIACVGLIFGSFALLFGISQKSRPWFWVWFPFCCLSILLMVAYCVAWWSGFAQGYWIALTVIAALGSVFNGYCFFVVCSLYKELGKEPKPYKVYREIRQRPYYPEVRAMPYPEPDRRVKLVRREFQGEQKRPLLQNAYDPEITRSSDDSGYPPSPKTDLVKTSDEISNESWNNKNGSIRGTGAIVKQQSIMHEYHNSSTMKSYTMRTAEVKVQLAGQHRNEVKDMATQHTSTPLPELPTPSTESSSDTDAAKKTGKYGRSHRGRRCSSSSELRSRSKSPHHKRIENRHRRSRHYDSDNDTCNTRRHKREHSGSCKPMNPKPKVPSKPTIPAKSDLTQRVVKPTVPQKPANISSQSSQAYQADRQRYVNIQSELTISVPRNQQRTTELTRNHSQSSLVSPHVFV